MNLNVKCYAAEKNKPLRGLVTETADNDEMIHPFQNRERFQV